MRLPFWLFVIWDCPIGFCYLSSETSFLAFCYLRPPFRFLLPCFFLLYETSFFAFCYLRLASQLTGLPAVHFHQAAPQLFKPSFHASRSHLPRKLDSPIWALKKNWQLMGPLDKPRKLGSPIGAQLYTLKKKTTGSPEQTIQTLSCNKLLAPVSHS